MRKETDLAFHSLRRRLDFLEMMTDTMKWITGVSEENDNLRNQLGAQDLTRLQLIESEREREDLRLLVQSLRERLDVWQGFALGTADIIFDLEKKGTKLTKAQRTMLARVLKESRVND